MTEPADKILLCRRCGKQFLFTGFEQDFYMQKGWVEPGHCPECRPIKRRQGLLSVCSGCRIQLGSEDPVYCDSCVDNLKLEYHGQKERIKELQSKLESLGELEQRLALVVLELEKIQQTNREFKNRIGMLQEALASDGQGDSLKQLNQQFGALRESYTCDIDKLTGLLLDIQYSLVRQQNGGLWHHVKTAFYRKTVKHETVPGKANNLKGHSDRDVPENM